MCNMQIDHLAPIYPYLNATLTRLTGLKISQCRALDVGGGYGAWLRALMEEGLIYGTLIDCDGAKIAQAAENLGSFFPIERWRALEADVAAMPVEDSSCEFVTCRSSLHFWPDLRAAIAEIRRVLVSGGYFFSGRGYGPDTPADIREQVKRAKKQAMAAAGHIYRETEVISGPVLSSVLESHGFAVDWVLPDGKAFWILARKI